MNDHILHEPDEDVPPFQAGKLYSLLDILGGGRAICDKCRRWQSFSALTPGDAERELSKDGWTFSGRELCPLCSRSEPPVTGEIGIETEEAKP